MRTGGVLIACLSAVLTLQVLPAQAVPPGGSGPVLRLERTVGPPTTSLLLGGRGFGPTETVDVTFDQAPLGHATTDLSGSLGTRISVPASARPGVHHVQATGETSGLKARATFLVRTDWAMFHYGPARTGSNPYENVLDSSNVSGLHTIWKFGATGGFSTSPAVVNGVVYAAGVFLHAIDARTGAELWSIPLSPYGILSSPAVAYGMVYVGAGRDVRSIDAATGTKVWTFPTGNSVDSSPAVSRGVVYVPSLDGNLYALNAMTGAEVWALHAGYFERSIPAVAGGVVYFGSADGHLYALDAATGSRLWATRVPVAGLVAPAIWGRTVYVGGADGTVHALNAATGASLWTYVTGADDIEGSPAVANGVVYVPSGSGSDTDLHALDAGTGTLLWREVIFRNHFPSSPVVANGVVYVDSPHEAIAALDAATGQKLWHDRVGGPVYTSAAVANGTVVVASLQGSLFAFGL